MNVVVQLLAVIGGLFVTCAFLLGVMVLGFEYDKRRRARSDARRRAWWEGETL